MNWMITVMMRITLTEKENKELKILSGIDTDYMCAGAQLSHAVSYLQRSLEHLKNADDDTAYEIQKIVKRIEDIKEENKKKRDYIKTRMEELWERFYD